MCDKSGVLPQNEVTMKKVSLAVICISALSLSGFAGATCLYGHDAKIAGAEDALDNSGMEGETDPRLLALLKKQEEEDARTIPIGAYNWL